MVAVRSAGTSGLYRPAPRDVELLRTLPDHWPAGAALLGLAEDAAEGLGGIRGGPSDDYQKFIGLEH
jgi:hypothetical protein